MKYLKYFETEAGYASYKNGSDFVLPNVSYVVDSTKVYYNPYEVQETRLVCTYNVTDTTNSTRICTQPQNFASMEVDGVLLNSVVQDYTFDTVGEHTVKFELVDPTTISPGSFADCTSLSSLIIPDSVTSIGGGAVSGCSGLTSVTIGNSVTSIGSSAFQNCSKLTSITIPDSVTTIDHNAFSGCSLTSVTIGNSVTTINSGAFDNLSGDLYINSNVPTYAFSGCSGLTSVIIGNSVTSIDNWAFRDCTGLTSVIIGNSVTSIGRETFYGCSNLTTVTIPDSVISIGVGAFSGCSGLTSVIIGNSVSSIDAGTFSGCISLNEITCSATTPPSIQSSTFYGVKENGIIKVPTGSDYSSWMSTGDYYLGKYNWTIEYI